MTKPRIIRGKKTRILIALTFGIITSLVSGFMVAWIYAPLMFWDTMALILLLLLWLDLRNHTSSQTAEVATRDDMTGGFLDTLLTTASIASLGGVVFLMIGSGHTELWVKLIHAALCLLSVVLSWAIIHSLYTIRYAALFYTEKEKCIDFGKTSQPNFSDFMYLAFTIGMTYQASDVTLLTSKIRNIALKHALLSFLFGTAIIATTINTLASLGN